MSASTFGSARIGRIGTTKLPHPKTVALHLLDEGGKFLCDLGHVDVSRIGSPTVGMRPPQPSSIVASATSSGVRSQWRYREYASRMNVLGCVDPAGTVPGMS